MSQENVEIVRGIYKVPDGITGAASERLAPDVQFDFTSVYPDRQVLRGAAAIRDGLVVYFKVYGDRAEALEAAGLSE